MSSIISAIGIATPSNCFSQMHIFDFMANATALSSADVSRLKKIYEASGIEQRYSVLADFGKQKNDYTFFGNGDDLSPFPTTKQRSVIYEENARGLAVMAIENLLQKLAGYSLSSVTHLITVSCTGMYAPGLDIDLLELLDLDRNVERTCINFMGCYGAFNALKVADYICRANPDAKVLIADVELCTLHFQKEKTLDNWISNSLFADGAAAVLVEAESSAAKPEGFRLNSFYTELVLNGKDMMAWRIGNTGFEMRLSSKIAKSIEARMEDITGRLLAKARLGIGEISGLAVHPGGRRILEVCHESLGFTREAMADSFEVLRKYGNMSSASVLFVLESLSQHSVRGEKILSYAFGPGLTFESMVLEKI